MQQIHEWLKGPFSSIEEAKDSSEYDLFVPRAVFVGDGIYYCANIREMDTPPHWTAQGMKQSVGLTMVAYSDPLLDIWHEYKSGE